MIWLRRHWERKDRQARQAEQATTTIWDFRCSAEFEMNPMAATEVTPPRSPSAQGNTTAHIKLDKENEDTEPRVVDL